ncbi:efflux RND transporter periplasmic adaptor subunit [Rhodanobacter sp. DHB23]|uniref:efflux RND transporter periplasmic adaptor subunit n=1 Tax=Rhodanobacter sp. DHB23 TaxID=2775923 RepID=UPI00177B5216|nr:efflux RND transporter periplasmic adaptor subunit [Rhodanobacter sp. DHB23]MBD8872487.1 efflux RND transporter periplasmic adaptor subunit [Rhodanobacter sp. DHB23]
MKSPSLRAPALCLGLLALTACGKKEQGPPQMPPPQVGVVTVQPQNEPLTKDLVGRLSSFRSADVRARVSGVLLKRVYVEGSDVKKGDLMFQIDPAPYQAALNSSIANLASAKATYTNAHVVAERDRQLIPQGYIARAQLDADEATERSAAAAVQQAQAAVETARINLGYTRVVSPIDGRSGQQQVTEGAIVGNGTADTGASATLLTTVDQIDPLYVNFTMSVADMEQLRQAQTGGGVTLAQPNTATVRVTLPDGSTYAEPGVLDFTAATVDPSTGAMNLRAQIPNPRHSLLPGMYVTLKAKLGEQHQVFLVPQTAVLRDTAGAYVFVVGGDGNVKRHDVATGGMSGSNWVVTGGLAAGDQVVVSGVQNVRDGAPAKASPWQPQPAAGGSAAAAGK